MSSVATASPSAAPAPPNPSPPRAGRPPHPRPTTYTGPSPTAAATSNDAQPGPSTSQSYPNNSMSQQGPPIAPPPRTSSQRQATTAPSAAPGGSTERSRSQSGRTRGQSTDGREREKSDRDRDRRRADETSKPRKDQPVGRSNSARDPTRNGTSSNSQQQAESTNSSGRRRQEGADGASGSAGSGSGSRSRGGRDATGGSSGLAVVNTPDGPGRSTGSTRKETRFGEYILGQTLGEGEFGKVKLGWRRDGGVQVAIKLIRRDSLSPHPNRLSKIHREISILRTLSHPNIVRLHEMVETERHIGIILEYASGGELFDFILNHRFLKDPPACRLFAQLVSGVGYLHKKGIVHRDLKLENLLLDRNRNIIITDFGFANVFDPNDELGELEDRLEEPELLKELEKGVPNTPDRRVGPEASLLNILGPGQVRRRGDLMATSCGSPCYAAPELVVSDGLYTGRKVDVWSCGVILYAMLAGYLPFDDDPANPEGDNINLLYKYIVSTPLTFPEYVSPHARDLLRRILVPDPRKRADLFEVARHSWLSPFSNVVSMITSSTINSKQAETVTINEPTPGDGRPALARAASTTQPKSRVDQKRQTVQVEYVEPRQQTKRGSSVDPDQQGPNDTPEADEADAAAPAPIVPTSKHHDNLVRAATTAGTPSRHARTTSSTEQQKGKEREVLQVGESKSSRNRPASYAYQTPSRAPASSDGTTSKQPSRRTSKDKSGPPVTGKPFTTGEAGTTSARPTTASSLGNSNRKIIATPKGGKPYTISNPIPHPDNSEAIGSSEMGKPSTAVLPAKYTTRPSTQPEAPVKGHKRANTVGGGAGGEPGRFLGKFMGSSEKPEISPRPVMTAAGEPRQSLDQGARPSKHDKTNGKSRRFSLLPTSFSLKSISGSGHMRRPSRTSGLSGNRFAPAEPQTSSQPQLGVPHTAGRDESIQTGSETSLAVESAPASAAGGRFERESVDIEGGNGVSRRPTVLQKNRKFTEGEVSGTGGSTGPARRVMDFFRRRGVVRSKGEV
ncbi:uncharacterized protein LAJ45_03324 [Morchella importuna]|uniref:uncharacterized protein n=1 Tax=Morchella importuna TaxID=1174673 RepID=UPI001E8E8E0F|nr:uncharacterized protein LAJ45_03324 [Morchella importuna]KAH8152484.1 hypothetical protein LAJ45_03324 [Morchella importuna]